MSIMKRIYMDYGSARPVDPRVLETMRPYMEAAGNPSSIISWGLRAKQALEDARQQVANLIGDENPRTVVFTGSATESNNIAIMGAAASLKGKGNHMIVSAIEHVSVLNPCKELMKHGYEVSIIPVDEQGMVDIASIEKAITDKTILISVMYANGEIGTIQPIRRIGEIAAKKDIMFHVDGTAACGKIPIDVTADGIDILTVSSNDLAGPQGVAALYMKKGVKLDPVMFGGGQERGVRSGTENIAGIAGMGKAAEIAVAEMDENAAYTKKLTDRLMDGLTEKVSECFVTGSRTDRLPNHASVRFSYIEGESIILNLDMMGVAAASGSACTSKTLKASHVLIALGLKHEEAHGSLVMTLTKDNTEEDVEYIIEVLPGIVERLRMMSPLTPRD